MGQAEQNGSKLRGTLRLKTGVQGGETKYPRIGKGEANQKSARHAMVYAVGRKVDGLIIDVATAAGLPPAHLIGDGTEPLGLDMVMAAYATINAADVPDDGMRCCIIGP